MNIKHLKCVQQYNSVYDNGKIHMQKSNAMSLKLALEVWSSGHDFIKIRWLSHPGKFSERILPKISEYPTDP